MTRLTEQQRRDRELSEAELRVQADDLAAMFGYDSMTVGPLRTSHGWRTPTRGSLGEGWPDSTFVHPIKQRLFFAEFKTELGKVKPAQEEVHRILRAAGFVVLVVRPSTLDEFIEVLRS